MPEKTDVEWLKYANEFHYGHHPEINQAVSKAIEALERTRWIPVSERLPEEKQPVLVTDGEYWSIAWWQSEYESFVGDTPDDDVAGDAKFWMPLPEPQVQEV